MNFIRIGKNNRQHSFLVTGHGLHLYNIMSFMLRHATKNGPRGPAGSMSSEVDVLAVRSPSGGVAERRPSRMENAEVHCAGAQLTS